MKLDEQTFDAYVVQEIAADNTAGGKPVYQGAIAQRKVADLPAGEILIRVAFSSLNFKDALSSAGNKGVTRQYPHTPGIDAAGVVAESTDAGFAAGDEVIVIGYDLGMNTAGGFGQYIRVPAGWVVKRPAGLTLAESMIIGTAGFTAALCVDKLLQNGLRPEQGPVLVTGASGGVGSFAVALLAQLGYEVTAMSGATAMSGSTASHDFLRGLGAHDIIGREDYTDVSPKPMSKELWAGAVDVVGGDILFNVVKSLKYGGSVACCGLVASPQFQASVFPFILRGVNLLGVDSVNLPLAHKRKVWEKLATQWKLSHLPALETRLGMTELGDALASVLRGESTGRLVLDLSA
ncbi:MAG: oxidoreductase [Gammaproteobacteria bacterium]|nr:oxidoreductase [Gammaproteobacteria bacterium]